MLVAVTPRDYRCGFEGKFKLGFFSGLQNYRQTIENLNSQKWALKIFRKITYHRPQNSVCFGEILQFRQRSLVPPVFQNELGKAGMAHMNLGWANLKPWDLCLPDKELS